MKRHTQTRAVVLLLSLVSLLTLSAAARLSGAVRAQAAVDFNRDIRPILSDKCWVCHGPDAASKKIKLRLDSETSATADLGGRRAIVPGHPGQSEMIRRINAADKNERMPPVHTARTLSPREIELLTTWIAQGAKWNRHWSFIKPVRPALPAVRNTTWPKNPIDYFVLQKLEQAELQPAPEADRATLLRRVSFDLTGLPPTMAELDGFLRDTSPNAYEKAVDRLLASPRYGERMAFKWLDAARYADTNGYQNDGDRSMWRWRDWVIDAFNQNKPFDEFTIEQLGGDLLPNATLEQRTATGFNRNHRQNSEDGLVAEEYAVEYVVDRVDTTATVFLGLTVGCARCHTHKYDPITHQEYYQLYAYFNSIREDGRSSYHNSPPFIYAPVAGQKTELQKIDDAIAHTRKKLDQFAGAEQKHMQRWERSLSVAAQATQWFPPDGLLLRHSLDAGAQAEFVEKQQPRKTAGYSAVPTEAPKDKTPPQFRDGAREHQDAPTGQGGLFAGKVYFDAGRMADFDYSDRLIEHRDQFAVSLWFRPDHENSGALVTHMSDSAGEKDGALPKNRGYGLFYLGGRLHWNIVSVWADDSWRVETAQTIAPGQWHHLVAIFDGREPYERARIYLDGRKQELKLNNGRLFRTFSDITANLRIGAGAGPEYRFRGMLDEVRVYQLAPDDEQIAMLACADALEKIAATPVAARTPGQRLKLLHAWLERGASVAARAEWNRLRVLRGQRDKLVREFPLVMVMDETATPNPAYVLRRGAYDMPGEQVERGLPAALQAGRPARPANRLELAQWLVSADNPLTARVTVNRFWQMLFGAGLVRTVEDFGAQGALPSHPELLDWLAVEFMNAEFGMRNGESKTAPRRWDVKAMLRLIVTSATYRQSSAINAQSADAENRLLARGPRFRLPAEMIRDQALSVAGLLVEKRGGPSVKPYQPASLLRDMVFSNMTDYDEARDEGLWRRSLYTYWKRTVLNPSMLVFDATAREQCTVRDTRTNTPLQALNLMNDVTYVEAARLLAERMLKQGGATPAQQLAWAFRTVTSRLPDETELGTLTRNLAAQRAWFRHHPADAEKLLAIGHKRNDTALPSADLAAAAATVSLILNLDEVITRH